VKFLHLVLESKCLCGAIRNELASCSFTMNEDFIPFRPMSILFIELTLSLSLG
jgi:hypothetical protein